MDRQKPSARPRAQAVVDRSRTRPSGLSHVTVPLTSEFVVVGNHLAQHPELSLVAIGISVHIQSLPPGRRVGIKGLAERFQEGAETIARAIRELERCGYLDRPRDRVGEGRFMTRTIAYNHPDAARQERAARTAAAEVRAAERKASSGTVLGRRTAAVPQQRAGAPAAGRHFGTRAAQGRRGAPQRPVRAMCTAADALRELWEPEATAVETTAERPTTEGPTTAVRPTAERPTTSVGPTAEGLTTVEATAAGVTAQVPQAAEPAAHLPGPAPQEQPVAVSVTQDPQPAPTGTPSQPDAVPDPPAVPAVPAAAEPVVAALDAPSAVPATAVAAPDASTIRASLPRPASPSAPSAAELERFATAVELLSGLRGRDERLTLSEKDVAKLAPSVALWLERGVEPDTLHRALLGELPPVVKYPVKFVGRRLIDRLPPPLPGNSHDHGHGRDRREAPRRSPVPPLQNCDSCDRAFRSPHPGRCPGCRS